MGQRLNIEIVNGGTLLANCYYHWSAYTESALELTRMIIEKYYQSTLITGVKMAVELLEATGGGVNSIEASNIQKFPDKFGHINFKNAVDRNEGLISVTEEGMEKTRQWEESRVTIDLSSETFCFDVVWDDSFDDYVEEYRYDDPDFKYESLSECPYDLSAVPFKDIYGLIEFIEDHPDGFREGEDTVIHWVS